jgi:hypothetical protein
MTTPLIYNSVMPNFGSVIPDTVYNDEYLGEFSAVSKNIFGFTSVAYVNDILVKKT